MPLGHHLPPSHALATFQAIGVTVPGLDDIVETWRQMQQAVDQDPGQDLAQDLLAGNVAPSEARKRLLEAALTQTAVTSARGVWQRASDALTKLAAKAVRDHGDAIIEALADRFSAAGDELVDTAGVDLPKDSSKVLASPHLAQVHARRTEAMKTLDECARVRTLLAVEYRYGPRPPQGSWWIAPPLRPESLARADQLGRRWLELVQSGFELRLNTPAEAEAIEQAAVEAEAKAKLQLQAQANAKSNKADRALVEYHQSQIEQMKATT